MEEELTPDQAQAIWNEEAAKLDAGDNSPAPDVQAAAADQDLPQNDGNQEPVEPAAAAADPAEPAPNQEPVDPLAEIRASMSQEINALKEANAQLLHHVKTAEGRVAAMQREFEQARRAQQSVAAADAPTQGQMSAAAKNPEKWEQLKQDFPEWAGAMEEYVGAKLGAIPQQNQALSPEAVAQFVQGKVAEVEQTFARRLEEARIEGKYENWKDTIRASDFTAWFAMQKPEVRALAESPLAKDAIRMLDMFEESKKRSATEIKQERGARLAAAATTRPGHTPPPKTLDDMSPEELWNYEARKRDETRAQRGF